MSTLLTSKQPSITSRTSPIAQRIGKAKSEKVFLVIEPHPAIAEVLTATLQLSQYRCSILSSLDLTASPWGDHHRNAPPAGILLDVDIRSMAFHHPFDVVQTFDQQWHHAFFPISMSPLILLTTHPGNAEALRRAGHSVIMKPFKPSVLMNQIKVAVGHFQEETMQEGRAKPAGREVYPVGREKAPTSPPSSQLYASDQDDNDGTCRERVQSYSSFFVYR